MKIKTRGLMDMSRLLELWEHLGDVPVFKDGRTEAAFLHFPEGTPCEDIWHWFEAQNPAFIVGDIQARRKLW